MRLLPVEKKRTIHKEGIPHLHDLEMEAILEIIHGKRLIHCHSYRQDEIYVFCTMESFGVVLLACNLCAPKAVKWRMKLRSMELVLRLFLTGGLTNLKFTMLYLMRCSHKRGCIMISTRFSDHARRLNLGLKRLNMAACQNKKL